MTTVWDTLTVGVHHCKTGVDGETTLSSTNIMYSMCPFCRLHSAKKDPSLQYANARLFEVVSQSVVRTLIQSPLVGMDVGVYAKVYI